MSTVPYSAWAHAIQVAHAGLNGAKLGLRTAVLVRSFKGFINQFKTGATEALDIPQPENIKKLGKVAREISDHQKGESDPPTDAELRDALKIVGARFSAIRRSRQHMALSSVPSPLPTRRPRFKPLTMGRDDPALMTSESEKERMPYPFTRNKNQRVARPRRTAEEELQRLQDDPRSAEEILGEMLRGNTQRRRREARGSGLTNIPEQTRGRIHVPNPVLPHNDVANDPYLIKSQHNNNIE